MRFCLTNTSWNSHCYVSRTHLLESLRQCWGFKHGCQRLSGWVERPSTGRGQYQSFAHGSGSVSVHSWREEPQHSVSVERYGKNLSVQKKRSSFRVLWPMENWGPFMARPQIHLFGFIWTLLSLKSPPTGTWDLCLIHTFTFALKTLASVPNTEQLGLCDSQLSLSLFHLSLPSFLSIFSSFILYFLISCLPTTPTIPPTTPLIHM